MKPLRPPYDGLPGVMHQSREILAMFMNAPVSVHGASREDILFTYGRGAVVNFLGIYLRNLLQEIELFRSVKDPNQDPIPSRLPLSEMSL